MRIEELKKAMDERPFRPFSIRMADGRKIQITHPDTVAWESDRARSAFCIVPGGGWEIIDIALATSLDMQAPASPADSL